MGENELDVCPKCGSVEIQKDHPFEHPPPSKRTWRIRKISLYFLISAFVIFIIYILIDFIFYYLGFSDLNHLSNSLYWLILVICSILFGIGIIGILLATQGRETIIVCECSDCGTIFELHSISLFTQYIQ